MSESKAYFLAGTTLATLSAAIGATVIVVPLGIMAIPVALGTASIGLGAYSVGCFLCSAVCAVVETITG